MRVGGLLFLGMCAIAAYGWWQVAGRGHVNVALLALAGVLTAGGLLSIVPLTVVLVRSVVAPRPVVAMDSGGLQLPDFAGSLPWAELAEVRLISGRGFPRSGQPYTIVAFVPRDPASVLSSLRPTGRRRRKLEKLLQLYGTPLVVADLLADHSGAEIAAAAAAFTVAPVRRF